MKKLKKINKNIYIIIVLLILFLFFSIKSYAETINTGLSNSIFRLHVIANSNSDEDQNLKFKVRDSLIDYMNVLTKNSNSKDETILIAKSHINDFKSIAQKTVKDMGFDYKVDVEVGYFNFPTKEYGDMSFPAGNYDALRVKIGDAKGKNWWCVMFPPLCFVDITSATVPEESKENLKESLSEEEYELISKSDESSEIKFKIVDIFNNFSSKIANSN